MITLNQSTRGRRSRNKGKRGEQFVAKALRDIFGEQTRRGWQARRGDDASDIIGTPFWIEVKFRKVVSIAAAIRQAITASRGSGQAVLLVVKQDRETPLAVMTTDGWRALEKASGLGGGVELVEQRDRRLQQAWSALALKHGKENAVLTATSSKTNLSITLVSFSRWLECARHALASMHTTSPVTSAEWETTRRWPTGEPDARRTESGGFSREGYRQ